MDDWVFSIYVYSQDTCTILFGHLFDVSTTECSSGLTKCLAFYYGIFLLHQAYEYEPRMNTYDSYFVIDWYAFWQ